MLAVFWFIFLRSIEAFIDAVAEAAQAAAVDDNDEELETGNRMSNPNPALTLSLTLNQFSAMQPTQTKKQASMNDDANATSALIGHTYRTTAILEAGRRSLDECKTIVIAYNDPLHPCRPTDLL